MSTQRLEEGGPPTDASSDEHQPDTPQDNLPLPKELFGGQQESPAGEAGYGVFEPEELPDLPEELLRPEDAEPAQQASALITDYSQAADANPDQTAASGEEGNAGQEVPEWGFSEEAIAEGGLFASASPEAEPLPRTRPLSGGGAATRMGILGGKQSGKSYWLHSLIYRIQAASQSGALSPYLRGGRVYVYQADRPDEMPRLSSLRRFIRAYRSWARLETTHRDDQAWYRLELTFRNGLLGTGRSTFQIGFTDSSGEYRETELSEETSREWRETFLNVGVMAFCLPLWAAFPAAGVSPGDKEQRQLLLSGFENVVHNYKTMLDGHCSRVRTMLVLTMADDRRGNLPELTDSWILPLLNEPEEHLRQLRREAGVARYILNARRVSETLRQEFQDAEPEIARIPEMLDFGSGQPWIIPVSAIEGATLESVEQSGLETDIAPVPAHVELPLLLALCESHNALM